MSADPVLAHCEAVIRRGSRSFSRAAALLPRRSRHAAWQLYAWCRHCDDVIDGQVLGQGRRVPADPAAAAAALEDLRRRTADALDGRAVEEPVFVGLQRIARDFGLPREHPFALLDGMAMDVAGRRYATFDELVTYCWHVAGVVGVMMAWLMERRDGATLRLAGDLGIAFQLTNVARDVMDDAAGGRVYLPLDWLARAGVPADAVADPAHRPAVAGVVAEVLDRAEGYYRSADLGLAHLPLREAWSIAAARGIYADIGAVVRRRGPRAWDRRAVVPAPRKLYRMGWALLRAVTRGRPAPAAG